MWVVYHDVIETYKMRIIMRNSVFGIVRYLQNDRLGVTYHTEAFHLIFSYICMVPIHIATDCMAFCIRLY